MAHSRRRSLELALADARRYHDYDRWLQQHASGLLAGDRAATERDSLLVQWTDWLSYYDDQLAYLATRSGITSVPRRPWTKEERAMVQGELADHGLDVRGDGQHFDDAAAVAAARCP